jgi:hypothetical protein
MTGMMKRMKRTLGVAAVVGATARVVHITLLDGWDDTWYHTKKSVKMTLGLVKPVPVHQRPTVVVLGTGWGALSFVRHLDHDAVNVKVSMCAVREVSPHCVVYDYIDYYSYRDRRFNYPCKLCVLMHILT